MAEDDGDTNWIAVIEAAKRGNDEQIEELVKDGVDPKKLDTQGNSALHWAAAGNHVDAINLLIKLGLDVNQTNNDGETPLHKAAWKENVDAAQALIDGGARPSSSIRDKTGKRPLDIAKNLPVKKIVAPVMTMDDVDKEKKANEAKNKP